MWLVGTASDVTSAKSCSITPNKNNPAHRIAAIFMRLQLIIGFDHFPSRNNNPRVSVCERLGSRPSATE
jgi:hypothetical protein